MDFPELDLRAMPLGIFSRHLEGLLQLQRPLLISPDLHAGGIVFRIQIHRAGQKPIGKEGKCRQSIDFGLLSVLRAHQEEIIPLRELHPEKVVMSFRKVIPEIVSWFSIDCAHCPALETVLQSS